MLSYKKWKKLNESVAGGSYTLGLSQRQKIADLQSRWDEMGVSMPPMKQSKKSKKMFGDPMGGGDDMGGDAGGPPPMLKKKGKKPPFPAPDEEPDVGPEGDDELDADMGDMGGDDEAPDEEGPPEDDADIGAADELGDDEEGDDLDAEDDDDDAPGVGGPEGGPTAGPGDHEPAPKKKGGSFIDKTQQVADGAKMMHKGAKKMIKGMREACEKCNMAKKKMDAGCGHGEDEEDMGDEKPLFSKKSKKAHKMTKEEVEFFKSLQAQTGGIRFEKDEFGAWSPVKEDAVLPPSDPNDGLEADEPKPGEVGFAPQGRVGGSFTEWAAKFKRKDRKINESAKAKGGKGSWFGQ
jgi:hypothetical protein